MDGLPGGVAKRTPSCFLLGELSLGGELIVISVINSCRLGSAYNLKVAGSSPVEDTPFPWVSVGA